MSLYLSLYFIILKTFDKTQKNLD